MARTILVVVEDLIFLSKIQQTARLLGALVETVDAARLPERAAQVPARAIVLDLNHRSGRAIEVLRAIKADPATRGAATLGFISHVQTELAAAARAAGCDQVLARSAFSAQLPEILKKLAGVENQPVDP